MKKRNRATSSEIAERVNAAAVLLGQENSVRDAIHKMAHVYDVSLLQAKRYVEAAQQISVPVPVPEPKVVLTVKVPESLPGRLRKMAKSKGQNLSNLVTHALEEFLKQNG